jgi:hypothetical protein|tara:strand:- start:2507 stop:2713 length:207 start_codon:yes stop_codon:yes gene_type:complete
MNTTYFVIMAVCVFGCGLSSYLIGRLAGIKQGAAVMYDHLVSTGRDNPDDISTVIVELEKSDSDYKEI